MMRDFVLSAETICGAILEVNPVIHHIKDLQGRAESLRGYL